MHGKVQIAGVPGNQVPLKSTKTYGKCKGKYWCLVAFFLGPRLLVKEFTDLLAALERALQSAHVPCKVDVAYIFPFRKRRARR